MTPARSTTATRTRRRRCSTWTPRWVTTCPGTCSSTPSPRRSDDTFVINAAKQLAAQSKIPSRNVTLINREHTYAHNDPAGAYPNNAFFTHLVTYLHRVDGH